MSPPLLSLITSHHNGSFLNDSLQINVLGKPSKGGAYVHYRISTGNGESFDLKFQNQPVKTKADVNGLSNEALLAVVLHRLEGFNHGPFPCNDNVYAIDSVKEALDYLRRRVEDRQERGVMGKYEA